MECSHTKNNQWSLKVTGMERFETLWSSVIFSLANLRHEESVEKSHCLMVNPHIPAGAKLYQ